MVCSWRCSGAAAKCRRRWWSGERLALAAIILFTLFVPLGVVIVNGRKSVAVVLRGDILLSASVVGHGYTIGSWMNASPWAGVIVAVRRCYL